MLSWLSPPIEKTGKQAYQTKTINWSGKNLSCSGVCGTFVQGAETARSFYLLTSADSGGILCVKANVILGEVTGKKIQRGRARAQSDAYIISRL